jgi:hypothetical protein
MKLPSFNKNYARHERYAVLVFVIVSFIAAVLIVNGNPQTQAACPGQSVDNGSANYSNVSVPVKGNYTLWARIQPTVAQNNSFMLEVDGGSCYAMGGSSALALNTWTWVNYANGNSSVPITVPLAQGNHNFRIVGSAAGIRVDRVLFLTDPTCTPSGTGDNCYSLGEPAPLTTPLHMEAGGSAYTDSTGTQWVSDALYAFGASTPWSGAPGSSESPDSSTRAIAGTTNQQLYLNGRWGMAGYKIPVQDGTYTLLLHFAEIDPSTGIPRIFDVSAEGKSLLTNFNIETDAGDYTADTKSFTVTVTGGVLEIDFSTTTNASGALVGAPVISGLEVLPVTGTTTSGSCTAAPSAPSTLSATKVTSAGASLNWEASIAGTNCSLSGYHIYRGTTEIATVSAVTTSYIDTAATAATKYSYSVTSIDTDGHTSAESSSVSVTTLAASSSATSVYFESGVDSKCLDDSYDGKANGTKVQIYSCNKAASQKWTINTNGTIENTNGVCLDLAGAKDVNNTKIVMYACNTNAAQQWKITNNTIVNPESGKCLDDPYSSITNGTQLILYTCKGAANQKWTS